MLAFALIGIAGALFPLDSLLGSGVSHALARYRAAHVRDVHYELAIDVTRLDTTRGSVRISYTRVNGGDLILDYRGRDLEDLELNGELRAFEMAGQHLRVPANELRPGLNVITARFKA